MSRAIVVVPRSQVKWLSTQPDEVLSAGAAHYDILEGDYAFTSRKVLTDPYHDHVLKKIMIRRMATLVPGLAEEVSQAMDETWGFDTQWKEIPIFQNAMNILPRVVNRMVTGPALCRNEDFLKNCRGFALAVMTTRAALRFVPWWLRFIVGPLAAIPNHRRYRNVAKYSIPLIQKRLQHYADANARDPTTEAQDMPNDYISWQIALASSEGREDELTPEIITRRILLLNFAGTHTTTIAVTNLLFNLASSPPSQQHIEGLREEVCRVYAEEGGTWTRDGLNRLHRCDSAIRESLRLSNMTTCNLQRKVVHKAGIRHAEGWSLPQGGLIAVDEHNAQHDPEIYPDPYTYDAFRFSRCKETDADSGYGSGGDHGSDSEKASSNPTARGDGLGSVSHAVANKNTTLATSSDVFLPFGHGRHACPGRFFVGPAIKLVLAWVVMNYELEPLSSRPPNRILGQNFLPPMKECIRVRRREGTVG